MNQTRRAGALGDRLTHGLQLPSRVTEPGASLSGGAAGIALLHIEAAHQPDGSDWGPAHRWLTAAVRDGLDIGENACLFYGVPALAYVLHHADRPGYRPAVEMARRGLEAVTSNNLTRAWRRIWADERPAAAEFDLIGGLTGLGVLLRRLDPTHPLLLEVLTYLVGLTQPIDKRAGWWTRPHTHPPSTPQPPGGVSNLGMAHGITGPLALLASCARQGITVPGHLEGIQRICAHLDEWEQPHPAGPWWPETINQADASLGVPGRARPARPSWCYGTPGIARAQQLAGIVLNDPDRQAKAEAALLGCLDDPEQMIRVVDRSLCHGTAGLYLTARAIAADALGPADIPLDRLAGLLLDQAPAAGEPPGYLVGTAGYALAVHRLASHDAVSATNWEDCLLLT
ncbi:hypothetical protein Kisp01_69970 [Kineosporia sp. NBRC 101677]|uniref:lanthionine synthetase C family protein n=1 Tax=Kineosporia sp. NBRC 101677 TaxID=3032197 RepID=UPI0024A5CC4D|nr:lanthionine synthetase C family protein [Kineosporia sp. NBRC 101677]GLY19983.1 hypothetical protein Kisp01_69970 [Kineosporia sp. NBRC 101677]